MSDTDGQPYCFSALQRAENSSISRFSSVSAPRRRCFSALQRAENSSIQITWIEPRVREMFQCSSASRKFLNPDENTVGRDEDEVSVLFSEPKIPQLVDIVRYGERAYGFSALQRAENSSMLSSPSATLLLTSFSALQRAENSSIANC